MNYKRVERLYREGRLQVRWRKRETMLHGEHQPLFRAEAANVVESMDFLFVRAAKGSVLKALAIVDDATTRRRRSQWSGPSLAAAWYECWIGWC